MATFNIVMPKLGESIQEATITKWFKKAGDKIAEEEALLEIATDKVDSEIPSPVDGVVASIIFSEGALVPVGEVIAIIDLDGGAPIDNEKASNLQAPAETPKPEKQADKVANNKEQLTNGGRFYSPLVKTIAAKENLSAAELEQIPGTGHNGRLRKTDVLGYIEKRGSIKTEKPETTAPLAGRQVSVSAAAAPKIAIGEGDQVVQMDRMRKLIAEHMVMSKQVSPHVTNFIEADVTNLVYWRNKIKNEIEKREGQKITFMPVFIEAVANALKKYPGINASADGDTIILRKNINIGVAVALPSGNLIVPVVKNADQKSLLGITVDMNKLAADARNNKLSPDDIQGGTFTISNFGSFGNLTGTPIINQPQAAILATGTIEKKPAVIETPTGDVIAIRHKMILALTYDHRIIDGALAGGFLQYLAGILGQFDINRTI
ncbi:MAG: 2-oxo acid dehydrogenase subunit E2 [Bacteroidales bacterium]|nr:2-oxo acid dehydrogenase subunit E2 [Bacteroidales bacterium]